MPIEFARAEFVKRSEGKNACHKSAYIDRSRILFNETKFQSSKVYDFSNRETPVARKIMLPEGADKKFLNAEILWNSAEQAELQHNSQVAIEFVIALPDDEVITDKDRVILTEKFAQQFVDKDLAAHYSVHAPDDDAKGNWHAHILIPTRTFSKDGQELNHLKDRALIKELANTIWSNKWRAIQNNYFKELGLSLRVDDRALVPEQHLGPVRLRANCLDMLERQAELKTYNAIEASNPAKILVAIENSKSVWQSQDVERFMAKHTPLDKIEEVRGKFWKQQDIIKLQFYKEDLHPGYRDTGKFTTLKVIEEEKQIIRRCDKVNESSHIKIQSECATAEQLNNPQHEAFKTLSGREGLAVLQGYAGSGKSYVLEALKNAYEAKGVTVRGFGPDNSTANLLKDRGFNAENIPRFLHAEHHGHRDIKSKELWIVDEAGKLGNQSLNELVRLAHVNKAKLILSGDPGQMPSVERGGMFQVLSQRYTSAKLLDIQRQSREEQREMAQNFAEGNIHDAISELRKSECLHFERDKAASIEKLIVDWSFKHYQNPEKSYDQSLIVATTNREVHVLNQAAHDVRMVKDELTKEEFSCRTIFGEIRVSTGDLIEFRKNDRNLNVTNGMRGELIDGKEDRFTVQIRESGENNKVAKIVSFDPKEYGSWQLGYATTTFRSQGRTVEDTYVLHSSNNSKQTAYVAMSRHQNSVQCYLSKEECKNYSTLEKQLSKDSSKETTLHYANVHDIKIKQEKESFERGIHRDKSSIRRWERICAYGREFKQSITDAGLHQKEKVLDKRHSNTFYDRPISPEANEIYGATKLQDIKIFKIEEKAMEPIKQDQEKTAEQQRIQEAILERQHIQQEKLSKYRDHCFVYDKSQISGFEKIFTPENERATVVLCKSQEAADKAAANCKESGYVFVSTKDSANDRDSRDVDLSALEGRKVLVWWSDHKEQKELCDKLKSKGYDNMHVKMTEYNFSKEGKFDNWRIESRAAKVIGSWHDVDRQNKALDQQLGIDKEQQRGLELGR